MLRRFESRVNPELLHDALDLGIDDLPGESDMGCDRAAVQPLRQEVEHVTLVRGELSVFRHDAQRIANHGPEAR